MKNYAFHKSLRARGVKLDTLAEELKTTKSHLSMVFNGQRGGYTRKHIAKLLTPEELNLLGWNSDGEIIEEKPPVEGCPRGTV